MVYGMVVREETVRDRTDRLASSAHFWLDEARTQMDEANLDGALEMVHRAEEAIVTLRRHATGRRT
ncbi:MAG: hypothetical protein Q8N53_12975 [Longimicrobiales bacterium]|nr:hypothetical protein [Longimicrobiales bacterium]